MLNVTCALIIKHNKLLIAQNNGESDHPFQWEFPGGKIKPAENAEECILREINEELHLRIQIIKPMVPVYFDYGFKKLTLIPFLCRIESGILKLNNHANYKWIDFSELSGFNFSGADKKVLQHNKNQNLLKKYIGK